MHNVHELLRQPHWHASWHAGRRAFISSQLRADALSTFSEPNGRCTGSPWLCVAVGVCQRATARKVANRLRCWLQHCRDQNVYKRQRCSAKGTNSC